MHPLASRHDRHRGGDPGVLQRTYCALPVPCYVRFMDSFPLTISGKVQKYLIREHLRSLLNLTEEKHA